jgi:hypothetical protein
MRTDDACLDTGMLPSVEWSGLAGPKPTKGFDAIRRCLSPTRQVRSNMPRPESFGEVRMIQSRSLRSHERNIANIATAVDFIPDRCKEIVNQLAD